MRYIWDQFDAYFGDRRAGWLTRTAMGLLRRPLQRWDVSSNDGVHRFVANSQHVARRIRSYWEREAAVLYPPVDWESFAASNQDEDFYLLVSALVPYKRVDLAIEAANRMKIPLKIIGTGQDETRLRQLAGPSVELLGWQPDSEIHQHYRSLQGSPLSWGRGFWYRSARGDGVRKAGHSLRQGRGARDSGFVGAT